MDARRHSVDFSISRTLFALRRVRSLCDPSTNSMSKLSALVDELNWETQSSSAIILGFGGECNDDYDSSLKRSSLFMADEEQHLCENELDYSLRNRDSRLVTIRNCGSDARVVKQDMACVREESRTNCKENGDNVVQINSVRSSSVSVDDGDSYIQPKRRLKQADNGCRGKSKCNSWSRKHNRLSRVKAGNVLSPDVSLCLSATTSDASSEGLSNGMLFYGSADVGLMESADRGSVIRNCWSSRTMKPMDPKLRTNVEESHTY